jgi:hypothetical protein
MKDNQVNKIMARALPDVENARLRLALLKENFEYQTFFLDFMKWTKKNANSEFWPGLAFKRIFHISLFPGSPQYKNILKAIDPFEKNSPNIDSYLPNLFRDPAVTLIDTSKNPIEGLQNKPLRSFLDQEKPWNRLYAIDLRKPKAQIKAEFEAFLEWAFDEKTNENHDLSYDEWEIFTARKRDEAWRHLEIWKLRKKKTPFFDIARQLNISIDVAKKSFARAYELTQEKKYDPVLYRREAWSIKFEALEKNPCAVCPNRATCTELCPEMLGFVNQDQCTLKEKLLEDSDYIDSLPFTNIY